MTDHDDALYLAHIDEAATLIERTAGRRGREAMTTDEDLRDATIYRLQTLAESTQHLSVGFKEAHPEIPWDDIAGLRNRLVHGYLGINLDIGWDVLERDLPSLARTVRIELTLRRSRERPGRGRGDDLGIGF